MAKVLNEALELYREEYAFFLEPIESNDHFRQWLNSQAPEKKQLLGGISTIFMAIAEKKVAADSKAIPSNIYKEFLGLVKEYESAVKEFPHNPQSLITFLTLEAPIGDNKVITTLANYLVENKEEIKKAAQLWGQTSGKNRTYYRNLINDIDEEVKKLVQMDFTHLDLNQDPVTYKEKADAIIQKGKEEVKIIYNVKNQKTLDEHVLELKTYLSATSLSAFVDNFSKKLTQSPNDFEQELRDFIRDTFDNNKRSNADTLRLTLQKLYSVTLTDGEFNHLEHRLETLAQHMDPEIYQEHALKLIEDILKKSEDKATHPGQTENVSSPYNEIPAFNPEQAATQQTNIKNESIDSKEASNEADNIQQAENSKHLSRLLFLAENTTEGPHLSTQLIEELKKIDLNLNTSDYQKQISNLIASQEQSEPESQIQQINDDFDKAVGEKSGINQANNDKLKAEKPKDDQEADIDISSRLQEYYRVLRIMDEATGKLKIQYKYTTYLLPLINDLQTSLKNLIDSFPAMPSQNGLEETTRLLEELLIDIAKIKYDTNQNINQISTEKIDPKDKSKLNNLADKYEVQKNALKGAFLTISDALIILNENSPSPIYTQTVLQFVNMSNVILGYGNKESASDKKFLEDRGMNAKPVTNLELLQEKLVLRLEACYNEILPKPSKYSLMLFSVIEKTKNISKLESSPDDLRNIKEDLNKLMEKVSRRVFLVSFFEPADKLHIKNTVKSNVRECLEMVNEAQADINKFFRANNA